jgi:flavin-dependent dehydrogenase
MKIFDVIIIGAGLAGLQCARLLSEKGTKVLLVDRKSDLTKGIHTTGIFVRKTFEDFEFSPETLGKPVRNVTLYSPKLKALELKSDKDEFRVGKMGLLYEEILQECVANGVQFARKTSYESIRTASDSDWENSQVAIAPCTASAGSQIANAPCTDSIVRLKKNGEEYEVRTKVLVAADGASSRVAKDLQLDENKEFIVGFEEVYKGENLTDEPQLHCFLDAKLAAGYLAWVTNDGEEIHIGVGGYPARFNPKEALEIFKQKVIGNIVDISKAELSETRGGKIPVGGVLRRIANERGLLIGDAAGAVSPLTAGGLDPAMRLSKYASEIILERLKTNDSKVLLNYSGEQFRARFFSRIWMRKILAAMNNQFLLEIGCAFLRLPVIKNFAKHVFFGRGSFPDDSGFQVPNSELNLKYKSEISN